MRKNFIVTLTLFMSYAWASLSAQGRNADVKRIEIDKDPSITFLYCDSIGEKGLILKISYRLVY